ncbi:MAG: hypothetical protein M1831_003507 [Alyxoria varia]|nr:MAG: hypothetical protein M1831_003507 [Alyxoria varia]
MSFTTPSSIAYTVTGTAVTGVLAYALYFDYKRRNDPSFRKQLKLQSRKQAKLAKNEAEEGRRKEQRMVRDMVDAADEEGYPKDAGEKEQYFTEKIAEAEKHLSNSSEKYESALAFYQSLQVYPNTPELMNLLDKTVPKHILDIIAEMIAYKEQSSKRSDSSDME